MRHHTLEELTEFAPLRSPNDPWDLLTLEQRAMIDATTEDQVFAETFNQLGDLFMAGQIPELVIWPEINKITGEEGYDE